MTKTRQLSTEDRLREAAITVFAKLGFAGATVKEIAEEAGVNVSLINYHYDGKEGLYRSCLERFGKERLQLAQQILTPAQSQEEFRMKLRLWMEQVLEAHAEYPQMITMINREMMTDFALVKDVFANTFLCCFQTLATFVEAGKQKGLLRKDLDAEACASMVFGSICHMGRTENIQAEFFSKSIRDKEYRRHVVDQMLKIVCRGVEHD